MDLDLGCELQKVAELQREESESFSEYDSSEFRSSIYLARMLADHGLVMEKQKAAKARINLTAEPS